MNERDDIFDYLKEDKEKRDLIQSVRNRVKRVSIIFLVSGTFSPLILIGMLILLYFNNDLKEGGFELILIVYSIFIPIQILVSLWMYYRYKKMAKLDDAELTQTKYYKNLQKLVFSSIYSYKGHKIIVKNTLDSSSLIIDNSVQDVFKGLKNRNFKLVGKIGNDKITAKYINKFQNSIFKVFYNDELLEEIKNKKFED